LAVYSKKIHVKKGSSIYNIDLVSSLAEATPLTLCYYNGRVYYASMVQINHGLATPLRVQNGGIYAVPTKNKMPYTSIYYTTVGNNTFTVPDQVTRIRAVIIGGGGGGLDVSNPSSGGWYWNSVISGGDGTDSSLRAFAIWYRAGGGKGGTVSVDDWGEYASYSDAGGAGGYPNGRAGGSTAGGAGWALGNGGTYGTGGSTSHSSYYVDQGETGYWARTYGGGGGSGGYVTVTLNTSPGTVYRITVGARGGNGVQGGVRIDYGEGIEP
jgi:hypothetical protein